MLSNIGKPILDQSDDFTYSHGNGSSSIDRYCNGRTRIGYDVDGIIVIQNSSDILQ